MGNKIPLPVSVAPVPDGDPSPFCWGPGKAFGDDGTPIRLILRISGVVKGPLWNPGDGETQNGEYLMTQAPVGDNIWIDNVSPLTARIRYRVDGTFVDVFSTAGIPFFQHARPLTCQTFLDNDLTERFIRGTARVWILEVQS